MTAVPDVELPLVPRTDDPVSDQFALAQRTPPMRTGVVRDKETFVRSIDHDAPVSYPRTESSPGLQISDSRHVHEFLLVHRSLAGGG